ncbi:MAG TPA: hypothetical protein EYG75_00815 [Campylobacterales bacterium]|nr:hypothetical protein [Campylobacterales bacterium]
MLSFIKPRKKKLLDDMSSLWLIFIGLMSAGLIGFGIYINYKSSFYIKMLEDSENNNKILGKKVYAIKSDIQIFNMQKELYQEVTSTNLIIKESVKNLFDLVPDQITLTDVAMEKNSLILKGYAISKETYFLLLEPPLKSIFDESRVSFSTNKKGFFQFFSKNSMQKSKGLSDD